MTHPATLERIAFYRARLDEEEKAARSATDGTWEVIGSDHPYPAYPGEQVTPGRGWSITLKEPRVGDVASELSHGDADHIVRHDPARTLRRVAAGRKLIALCLDESLLDAGHLDALDLAISEWDDHDDYQERWKP